MAKMLKVTRTLTIVQEIAFDKDHYGDATLDEAIGYEKDPKTQLPMIIDYLSWEEEEDPEIVVTVEVFDQ